MLYDPDWNKQRQTDPFDSGLHDLISWLETKNPTDTYDYPNSENCMLCQYLRSQGIRNVFVNSILWGIRETAVPGYSRHLPSYFDEIAKGVSPSKDLPSWSFGAALLRAKQYLPKTENSTF